MKKTHNFRKSIKTSWALFLFPLLLLGCIQAEAGEEVAAATGMAAMSGNHAQDASHSHTAEIAMNSPIELNPSHGKEIGWVYAAYLSPEQEGGEEEDTPDAIPDVFRSTAPSVSRELRTSHGHGTLSFTNDLSKAYVHVVIEDVNPEEINMFHIHCGRPGQLGPIIVDFNLKGDPAIYFEDGVFSMEILNEDIEAVVDHGEGLIAAFTAGCPIVAATPMDRVKTIAGMHYIAEQGELYFNLHTVGQTYFGDIRGQMHRVETPSDGQIGNQ